MERDSICINGQVTTGENGLQHIVGEFMRAFLDKNSIMPVQMSEAHCLEAAWEILFKCCRTTSAGDTYLVLENLCHNSDLVVLVPADNEAYPLAFTITAVPCEEESFAGNCGEEREATISTAPSAPLSSFNEFSPKDSESKGSHKNKNNSSNANCHHGGDEAVTLSHQPSPKSNSVKALLHWHLLSSKGNRRNNFEDTTLSKKDELGPLNNDSTPPKHHRHSSSRKYRHRRFFSDASVTVPLEHLSSLSPTSRDMQEQPLSWSEHKQEVVSDEEKSPTSSTRNNGDTSSLHRNGGARIIVSCVAHTSYKLTSVNPTDMDSDVYGKDVFVFAFSNPSTLKYNLTSLLS